MRKREWLWQRENEKITIKRVKLRQRENEKDRKSISNLEREWEKKYFK